MSGAVHQTYGTQPAAPWSGVSPERLYRALLDSHPEPTFSLGPAGEVLAFNRAFARFCGLEPGAATPTLPALLVDGGDDDAQRAIAAVWEGRAHSWKAEFRGPDDTVSVGYVTLAPVVVDGTVVGAQGIARDVTLYQVIEEQLQARIFTDPLTGLANRTQLAEAIERACRRGRAPGEVAVLFLDVDDFKLVNDALGHPAGDALLAAIADRLRGATRGRDLVARLGGDEFAILLDALHAPEDVLVVVDRIQTALRDPVEVDTRALFATVSIGIAHWDGTATGAEIVRNADLAMYRAKALGKARHAVYDAQMQASARERLELANDLRTAIRAGAIDVAYQPIVDLATGEVLKAEALARWTHPQRGPVSPAAFIPLAEEVGLIEELGALVLREGCRQLATWDAARGRGEPAPAGVTINVSGRQVDRPGALVAAVQEALRDSGADPRGLTLELTESVAMRNPERMLDVLGTLAADGIALAIDDFGTGYSSLAYLHRFPVRVLKIDRSFVRDLGEAEGDAHAQALVRTIVSVATALGLQTVAEGVETPAQAAALRALGCDMGQGYLFGRPGGAGAVMGG